MRALALATTVAVAAVGLLVAVEAPGGTEVVTTTLTPVADTYVDASTPTTTYGTNARLVADASPVREVYLRFDLSALSGPVQSARLRMHVADITDSQSPAGGNVARIDNTVWPEALAVRASRKLRSDELLITSFGATRLRMEMDRVPLWRGDQVPIPQLVDDFGRYLYLPRLKGQDDWVKAFLPNGRAPRAGAGGGRASRACP